MAQLYFIQITSLQGAMGYPTSEHRLFGQLFRCVRSGCLITDRYTEAEILEKAGRFKRSRVLYHKQLNQAEYYQMMKQNYPNYSIWRLIRIGCWYRTAMSASFRELIRNKIANAEISL